MELHHPQINDYGGAPVAEHDVACAVCGMRHAVLDLNAGVFLPCWSCQKDGWMLKRSWWRKRFARS